MSASVASLPTNPKEARKEVDRIAKEKARRGIKPRTLVELYPPNPGPQEEFLVTEADIAVIGGSAGGGKTIAELLEPTQDADCKDFNAVIFRRTMKQVRDEGGIWDQSMELYPLSGAKPNLTERFWTFPGGASIQFAGIETDADKYTWKGAQICAILFDELTEFLESQFWYLMSRNRSACGRKVRIRASTNPAPGWVKRLLAPWVDRTFPDPAKSGEIRWFFREHDKIVWCDAPPDMGECTDGNNGKACLSEGCRKCFQREKSITFIRSTVYDNPPLLAANPGYIGNLQAQDDVEMRRLLLGDWDAKPANLVISAFDESKHVRDVGEIDIKWRRGVGLDFGDHNGAELAFAQEPETGKWIVIGENWPGHHRDYPVIASDIRSICGRTPDIGAGGNRTTEQGWRQSYRKESIPVSEPNPKHADPKLQYKVVNDAFSSGLLEVSENCPMLIKMLTEFQRKIDPKTGEVTDEFDDSSFHLATCLRYFMVKVLPPLPAMFSTNVETVTKEQPLPQVQHPGSSLPPSRNVRVGPGGGFLPTR